MPNDNEYTLLVNYSDEYRVLFFRVPKVANSSFRTVFTEMAGGNNKMQTLAALKDSVGERWSTYLKAGFVRNPYDRLVSCWRNKTTDQAVENYPNSVFNIAHKKPFSDFVDLLVAGEFGDDRHILPQVFMVPPFLDFTGRFENLQADYITMCEKAGMKDVPVPHKNKTSKSDDYREFYDDASREKVSRYYAEDLEAFGYSF